VVPRYPAAPGEVDNQVATFFLRPRRLDGEPLPRRDRLEVMRVGGNRVSATGLEVFDKTLQTTNIWLDEIETELGPDR
jgi:hypothetical protein